MRDDLKITTSIAAALLASACGQSDNGWGATENTAICTDKAGNRVADSNCGRREGYGGSGVGHAFLWYYLARGASIPYYGERAGEGSFSRSGNTPYFRAPASTGMTRSAAVSRGGFGSIGEAHGGGGE